MSLLKTVLKKTKKIGVTAEQFLRIQETFKRESAAATQRWETKFQQEEDLKNEALARAERAELLLFELEEKAIEEEDLRIQKNTEQHEMNALKQFEFEEVGIIMIHLLTLKNLDTLQLEMIAATLPEFF